MDNIILGISITEWLGYLASVLVLVSLLMNSILRLRWINLAGSLSFSFYGFVIGALPVGIMNFMIALINIWYLIRIYTHKEYFNILEVEYNDTLVRKFLDFYKVDIAKFYPGFDLDNFNSSKGFFVMRNMVPACLLLYTISDSTAEIIIDYATLEYRDFKTGNLIYAGESPLTQNPQITKLMSKAYSDAHIKYLSKMGFEIQNIEDNYSLMVKSN